MSNAIYPTLPGLSLPVRKMTRFSTNIKQAVSGREIRLANWTVPLYTIQLVYEFLRQGAPWYELEAISGFYAARMGAFDNFLWTDPEDGSVSAHQFAVADGIKTQYQLTRTRGGATEPVANPSVATVSITGATAQSVSAAGIVTFAGAPASGTVLSWSGSYYHRCRFADDNLDTAKFMARLYESKQVNLIGTLGGRI